MLAAFQTLTLDKKGSDCGSTDYFKILLTKDNKDFFLYRYIKKGSSLVCLSPEEIDKHLDTYISLRSPLYCKSEKICNKCAGELFYMLGMENIGLTTNKLSSISLNASLKQFHDQSIHTSYYDFRKYFY
jgi:hypothetical protein